MSTYETLVNTIDSDITNNLNDLFTLNLDIADNPELSGEEFETVKKIKAVLEKNGFFVETPYGGMATGFCATAGPNNHKYKIAIMAEYDALPDIGHACGHSLSGSISCLAGIATKSIQDALDADIHIVGTPAEETSGGKVTMIENGVFDKYDMAIMVHLYNENLPAQTHLALLEKEYIFHGKSAHSSSNPWDGINALNAVQLMFHGVDMLRQHVTPDVRMHGYISNGGIAPNIVPEEAKCEFYVRALKLDYANQLLNKLDDIADGACLMTGATVEKIVHDNPFADVKQNEFGNQLLQEVYDEIGLPKNGHPDKIFGSSDAGNVSYVCPTFHACLQLSPSDVPIHSREFEACVHSEHAKEVLEQGAKIISHQIAKIFSEADNIQAMKNSFAEA